MRVIAGTMRGRKLCSPGRGLTLRATSDKVKEALFNIIAPQIEGAEFLDLYAGSGAVGIEAVSRGAKRVVFVEQDRKNVALLKKNLSLCSDEDDITLFEGAAADFLRNNRGPFDIVFIDPPYADTENGLQWLSCCDTIRPQGQAIIEHFHKVALPDTVGDLMFSRRYRYGGTVLSFYVKT